VQTLARNAGLSAAPIDPLSTTAIGGNPHQAKMAGTPNQLNSAIRMSTDPNQQLATAVRQEQPRQAATAAEQQKLAKSKEMQDLGQLGDRVTGFIDAQKQKLEQASITAAQATEVKPSEQIAGMVTDPAKLTSLKNAAKQLLANPQDMQALLTINQALGRDQNSQVTPAELNQLYASSTDTLAKSAADNLENDLQVEDLIAAGNFPYTADQLGALLNIPTADVSKYNISQLRAAIEGVAQQEFSATQQLGQQANSNLIGTAERGTARALGKEASRTGLRSTEQDINNLEQQIANADQVSFGGQTYNVEELLKDDTISSIVSDYLNSAPGSELRQRVEQSEPELVKFINNNQAVLEDAASQLTAATKDFADLQQQNQDIAKVGNTVLSDDLMASLFPDFDQLNAAAIDPSQSGFFQRLNTLPPEQKEAYANTANILASDPKTKDLIAELASLSPDQLASLELEKGLDGSPKLRQLVENRAFYNQLQNTSASDPDKIINLFSNSQFNSLEEVQAALDNNKLAKAIGLSSLGGAAQFDLDKDGKVDSPESLLARMQQASSKANLTDILNNSAATFAPKQVNVFNPASTNQGLLFDKLKGAAADGNIQPYEVTRAGLSPEEVTSLLKDKALLSTLPPHVQEGLKLTLDKQQDSYFNNLVNKYTYADYEDAGGKPIAAQDFSKQDAARALSDQSKKIASLEQLVKQYKQTGQPPNFPLGEVQNSLLPNLKESTKGLERELVYIKIREKQEKEQAARAAEKEAAKQAAKKLNPNANAKTVFIQGKGYVKPIYKWDDKAGAWRQVGYTGTPNDYRKPD
jgi:hypothetical protein